MPKRLRQQRRGKGKQAFRAPSFRFKVKSKYRTVDEKERTEKVEGKVVDIINDPARTTPVLVIQYADGKISTTPAPYMVKVGDSIQAGVTADVKKGNVLPLKSIPPGTVIFNVENIPGDGGKFVRASGVGAKIMTKESGNVIIKLPSKAFKKLDENCRATIGVAAGFGRKEKPIIKAGNNFYIKKGRGKYWPHVSGVAMNAINHPHGGKRRSTQHTKNKSVARNTPPGRKVGSIAPKRTGRKNKKN